MRTRFRLLTVSAAAGLAVLGAAGPAFAHVEVSADKNTAGATDVTLTFTGEAENPKAGIQSERVVLPTGVAPAEVSSVKLPAGWSFSQGTDGFTVGGKALKTGTNAVWSVKIAKLPDGQTRLSFKTVETYGNGDVSRWIEIQQPGQAEPDNPAPLVVLKPGPSAAPTSAASATESPTPAPAITPATTPAAAPAAPDNGSSTWWIWVVLGALIVAAIAFFLVRRRGATSGD